jgi:hypothetical protein
MLTQWGKDEKEKLTEKAIKAIERLSFIPGPDVQSALFGRRG